MNVDRLTISLEFITETAGKVDVVVAVVTDVVVARKHL
jgi:hypothetical protein